MASSRKSKRSGTALTDLTAHVAACLKTVIRPGDSLVLGLSGGIDSMVLLDLLVRLHRRMRFALQALHVNHQISPNAARWARYCVRICRERCVACRVVKVSVKKGNSLERAAREARYEALSRVKADYIVLAHNKDDQAETVLMQLMRGAGIKGLAGMPLVRAHEGEIDVIRPLLAVSRDEIECYAKSRRLAWIDDESNVDTRYMRNWLRHEVLPRIAERVPAYRETVTRAAQNFSEAAALLDELARSDAVCALEDGGIRIDLLRHLSMPRAKNLLRFLIGEGGWGMPDAERLNEALRQALHAKADAKVVVGLGACELRRHRGVIRLVPARTRAAAGAAIAWKGERELALPNAGGILRMARSRGKGLSAARLESEQVTVRPRRGGERLQPDARRPRRTAKNLLQEARIPAWERERLPFVYCGETLACIPGIAIDYRFRAKRGEVSILPRWDG